MSNRIAQIQSTIPGSCWYHVPSAENPADCASRGLTPNQLISHTLWWAGPPWLLKPQLKFDLPSPLKCSSEVDLEKRKIVLISEIDNDIIDSLLEKFSSLEKLRL